jgi:hypothetical protein
VPWSSSWLLHWALVGLLRRGLWPNSLDIVEYTGNADTPDPYIRDYPTPTCLACPQATSDVPAHCPPLSLLCFVPPQLIPIGYLAGGSSPCRWLCPSRYHPANHSAVPPQSLWWFCECPRACVVSGSDADEPNKDWELHGLCGTRAIYKQNIRTQRLMSSRRTMRWWILLRTYLNVLGSS